MIPLIIFFIHIVVVLFVFVSQFQKEGVSSAFVSLAFFLLIFSVGWSICTYIATLLLEPQGFGFYLDRNTIALIMLTVTEGIFYTYFFKDFILQQN